MESMEGKLRAALTNLRVELRAALRFLRAALRNLRVKVRAGFKSEGKSEGCDLMHIRVIKVRVKVRCPKMYLESDPIWYQNGPNMVPPNAS